MQTPVVVILFNRPDKVASVMRAVAAARPDRLFLVADGPRPEYPDDVEQCRAARQAAEEAVNWPCEVRRDYAESNLGCGLRPASGISWVFEQVDRAIILEDDCVPHPTFFRYCEELLERYRDDDRVMHINGSTYRAEVAATSESYYFTQFVGCWGWATWRRAWRHYDFSTRLWPHLRASGRLEGIFRGHQGAVDFYSRIFQNTYDHPHVPPRLAHWDYQWAFACWANSGLGIVPRGNLVSNVGCGSRATHTFNHPLGNMPTHPMAFPLVHPPAVARHDRLDQQYFQKILLPEIQPRPARKAGRWRRWISRLPVARTATVRV